MLGHPTHPAPVPFQVGTLELCVLALSFPFHLCQHAQNIGTFKEKKKPTPKGDSDSTGSQVKIAPLQEDTYCSSTPPRGHVCASTEQTNAKVSSPRTTAERETHCRRLRSPSSRAAELCPHLVLLCRANNQEWFGRQRTLKFCKFQLWGR